MMKMFFQILFYILYESGILSQISLKLYLTLHLHNLNWKSIFIPNDGTKDETQTCNGYDK